MLHNEQVTKIRHNLEEAYACEDWAEVTALSQWMDEITIAYTNQELSPMLKAQ